MQGGISLMGLLFFLLAFSCTICVPAVYSTFNEKQIMWRQRIAAFFPGYAEWLPSVRPVTVWALAMPDAITLPPLMCSSCIRTS